MYDPKRFVENVLVTGCPRSGTSMVAALLAKAEVFTGIHEDPSQSSMEHSVIKKAVIRPHLQAMSSDPMGFTPLPPEDPAKHIPLLGGPMKLLSILLTSGYRGGVWMVKSSRLILMWPAMHNAFPKSLWVVVRRNPEEIVRSCRATGSINGVAPESMDWAEWVASHERRFEQLKASGANVFEIWPNDFFHGNFDSAREMLRVCGRAGWADESINWLTAKLRERG